MSKRKTSTPVVKNPRPVDQRIDQRVDQRVDLYTSLSKKKISSGPLTESEIQSLLSISEMCEKEALAIRDIIKQHHEKHGDQHQEKSQEKCADDPIPYNGVQQSRGVEFDIQQLPPDLARIIVKFVEIASRSK
jgi:hypothetical protein